MDVISPYATPNRIKRARDRANRVSHCHRVVIGNAVRKLRRCDYRFWFHVILYSSAILFSLFNYYYFATLFELLGLPRFKSLRETQQPLSKVTTAIMDHSSPLSSIGQPSYQKIPRTLIFTHHINLLSEDLTGTGSVIPSENATLNAEAVELRVLQDNVRSILALHQSEELLNNATTKPTVVRFLTDADCIHSIRQWALSSRDGEHATKRFVADEDPKAVAEELIQHFQNEPMGMYKADLCRGVALYETGGIYFDVDLGVRMNLFSVLQPDTEFATIQVHRHSKYPGAFFQAMIAVTPQHDVIHRYVQLFLQHYRNQTFVHGPLGVLLLRQAYDEILKEQVEALYGTFNANTTTSTHLQKTTELWQEILYVPELEHTIFSHVPRPTWGRRRACRFVVVVPPRHELGTSAEQSPLVVPMYSRIAGSRMCPVDT